MGFRYNTALSDNKDIVRLLIGDTVEAKHYLDDSEINWFTGQAGNVWEMAALAAKAIASKLAVKVDKAVGDLKISYSQQHTQYLSLATELKRRATTLAVPVIGGVSIADKDVQRLDSDRVQPGFIRNQFDHPEGVSDSEYSDYTGKDS